MTSHVSRWWLKSLEPVAVERELNAEGWRRDPVLAAAGGPSFRMLHDRRCVEVRESGGTWFVDCVNLIDPVTLERARIEFTRDPSVSPGVRLAFANESHEGDSSRFLDWLEGVRFSNLAEWVTAAERLAEGGRMEPARVALRCADVLAPLEDRGDDRAPRRDALATSLGIDGAARAQPEGVAEAMRKLGFVEFDRRAPNLATTIAENEAFGVFAVRGDEVWSSTVKLYRRGGMLFSRMLHRGTDLPEDDWIDIEGTVDHFPRTIILNGGFGSLRITEDGSGGFRAELR